MLPHGKRTYLGSPKAFQHFSEPHGTKIRPRLTRSLIVQNLVLHPHCPLQSRPLGLTLTIPTGFKKIDLPPIHQRITLDLGRTYAQLLCQLLSSTRKQDLEYENN